MSVDVDCFSEDELKIIAALAFDDEPATLPELSVATRLKPSVVKYAVDNLLNKQVLTGYYTHVSTYKLHKNHSQSLMKDDDYVSPLDLIVDLSQFEK